MVQRLQHLYGYDALIRFTADPADLNDGSDRTDEESSLATTKVNPRFRR